MALTPRVYILTGDDDAIRTQLWRTNWQEATSDWGVPNGAAHEVCMLGTNRQSYYTNEFESYDRLLGPFFQYNSQTGGTDYDGIYIEVDAPFYTRSLYMPIEGLAMPYEMDYPNDFYSDYGVRGGAVKHTDDVYYAWGYNFPRKIAIYSSSDRITWTELDSGNAPALTSVWHGSRYFLDDNIVQFIHRPNASATVSLYDFDLVTGTWGSAHDTLTLTTDTQTVVGLFKLSTGETVVVYERPGAFPQTILGLTYLSGGVWSTEVQINSGLYATSTDCLTASNTLRAWKDDADRMHFSYYQNANGGRNFHRTWTLAGGVGTEYEFSVLGGGVTGNSFECGLIFDDQIWLFAVVSTSGNIPGLCVWKSPVNAQTFTQTLVDDLWGNSEFYCCIADVTTAEAPPVETPNYGLIV